MPEPTVNENAANRLRVRITGFKMVKASDVLPAPVNPRGHGAEQRSVLQDVLGQFGFAGALLTRTLPDGRLQLVDGHMRRQEAGDTEVPVLLSDLSEDEAKALIMAYDEIGRMAKRDHDALQQLLATAPALSERVMDGLHLTEPPSYRDIMETKPPPKLVWVLVGVPIDRFGEVRPQVTALQAVAGVSVQVNGDGQ